MKTAKTLQLLDANNNNISPAVCVDSLYFEQSLDDGTYRMSLRNRILVAAESMDLNLGVSGAQDLEAVEIPYFYANAATGTGGTVYELHTGRYELGKKIAKAFKAYGDEYYLNKNAASDYIHINGDNGATDTLNVGWSNGLRSESVIIKAANASSNIMFGTAGANGYIKVSTTDKKMTVDAKNQFDVSATIIHTNSQDFVLTATGNTTVQTNKLNVNSSYEGNITTGALLTLNSNKGIDILSNITAADNNINIRGYNVNIDTATEGKITLYGKTFPRPIALDSNTQQLPFLRQNNANAMEWGFLPTLVVKDFINTGRINFLADTAGGTNGNNPSPNYAKYYISMKHLSFKLTGTGSTAWKNYSLYTTVDEPADSDKQVMFKSLSSGTVEVPIDFTSGNPNSSISFITINGKSIIKTGNSDSIGDINVVLLGSTDIKTKSSITVRNTDRQCRVVGMTPSDMTSFNDTTSTTGSNGSLFISPVNIYFDQNGKMYASQFYSTSDERMKEEISTLDYIEMPEIKQFKWKETDDKSYGFIAQELEEYGLDELVSINKDGYKTVNYNAAYAIAINNANKKIKNLEEENKDLRTEVSLLTDKLNMLESLVMSKLNQ